MKTLLDYSSDALQIADSNGNILYVTQSIEKNIRLERENSTGKKLRI